MDYLRKDDRLTTVFRKTTGYRSQCYDIFNVLKHITNNLKPYTYQKHLLIMKET